MTARREKKGNEILPIKQGKGERRRGLVVARKRLTLPKAQRSQAGERKNRRLKSRDLSGKKSLEEKEKSAVVPAKGKDMKGVIWKRFLRLIS